VIRETVGHLRDLPRYRQILTTLVRYGYQDVVAALHLEGIVRPIERVAHGGEVPHPDREHRLRMICEDLGPTFVKLGQVLSTRPDLLPESYIHELTALRSDVRPFSFEQVESILTEEYSRPLAEVFASVDPQPVASASISQVHSAMLPDGRKVALKVRRPDIVKVVNADMDIIRNLAQLVERRIPSLARYRPVSLAREFERSLKRELDFSAECRAMERCHLHFVADATAHVPLVFPALSTSRVIVMEFVGGVAIDDLEGIRAMGVLPAEVAVRGARILLRQIFEFGFFHADPHPGNLRVLPGGVVAMLDYGMFGQLDVLTREWIAEMLLGLLAQDIDQVIRAMEGLDIRGDTHDPRGFRRDLGELVTSYSVLTLDNVSMSTMLRELITLIRNHSLQIPPELVLLIRALVTIEGVGRVLDPHFDIARELAPFLQSLVLRRFHPIRMMNQTVRTTDDLRRIATLLPDLLSQTLESIKRGEMNVHFELRGFPRMVRQISRTGNTVAMAMVIAAMLIASALVLASGQHNTLAYGGFGTVVPLLIWMAWNMSRG
jgi:ubiquinone biosynthesis protein